MRDHRKEIGCAREVRSPIFHLLPEIALTAYARQDDQQKVLAHGFQYHLSKPLDIEVLVKTITELASP
ncbi:MAG: hypothetical protein ACFB0C_25160 [Leptolyngbyaceae cyanobacterium]